MHSLKEQKGFTLIELLIVVAIIGILAAIAIPGYLGMQERSKKGTMLRAASASEPELQVWLNSALKSGIGANLTENDTNGDGAIQSGVDLDNAGLAAAGVCITYVNAQNIGRSLKSPWTNIGLWATVAGAGQISCTDGGAGNPGNITLIAKDKDNVTIHYKIVSVD